MAMKISPLSAVTLSARASGPLRSATAQFLSGIGYPETADARDTKTASENAEEYRTISSD